FFPLRDDTKPRVSTDAETTKIIVEAFGTSPQKSTRQAAHMISSPKPHRMERWNADTTNSLTIRRQVNTGNYINL
ncbi:hypothetical protein L9F63_011923, partial [Diploptera punctata]